MGKSPSTGQYRHWGGGLRVITLAPGGHGTVAFSIPAGYFVREAKGEIDPVASGPDPKALRAAVTVIPREQGAYAIVFDIQHSGTSAGTINITFSVKYTKQL